MPRAGMTYVDEVPEWIEERVRAICLALPDAYEDQPWKGFRWAVRKRTFANVLSIDDAEGARRVVLAFRSEGDELEMLLHAGHPFFALRWGRNAVGLVLDDDTDWDEVRELITDSYCVMAPKKLGAQVDRPPDTA